MQHQELLIKSVLDSWYNHVSRTDNLLDTFTDEQLQNEIAPGKNRGIYLLGHLTAVHDRMLPLLNLGKQHYPHFDDIFITSPDKAAKEMPPASELRIYWKNVNEALAKHFSHMQPDDWFQKHTSVSDADFAKEPYRNKLNVLVSRTNHLAYHFGQLLLLT
jgi:hypothetical protein